MGLVFSFEGHASMSEFLWIFHPYLTRQHPRFNNNTKWIKGLFSRAVEALAQCRKLFIHKTKIKLMHSRTFTIKKYIRYRLQISGDVWLCANSDENLKASVPWFSDRKSRGPFTTHGKFPKYLFCVAINSRVTCPWWRICLLICGQFHIGDAEPNLSHIRWQTLFSSAQMTHRENSFQEFAMCSETSPRYPNRSGDMAIQTAQPNKAR